MIYHLHIIQYPATNDYIKVNLDYGTWGSNTRLCPEMILQVSVHKLHIDMIKKHLLGFPWKMMKS